MSTTIGEVNINLRMSLAQFQQDVKQGSKATQDGTKQIADSTKGNIGEAREALRLLGEDIGVSVPRGLQSLIAGLPGVGTALQAAFSGIAVIALIDLIGKVGEAVQEFRNHAEEVEKAWNETGEQSKAAMLQLSEEFTQLSIQLDKITGDDLKALQDQLKLIDEQSPGNLTKQLQEMQKAADAAFASMKESWFQSLLNGSSNLSTGLKYLAETFGELAEPIENWITGGASANEIILKLQQGYDGLSARVQRFAEAGDTANAISTIVNGIVEVQKALAKPIQDENVKEALAGELGLLTQMLERYQAIQKNADMAKVVATTREVTEELNRELETLQGLESATDRVFEKSVDENTRQQELVKELIAQWEGYADALNKAGINSGSAGQAIEDLQLRLKELQAEAQASVDKLLGMSDAYRKLVENFTATAGDHIPLPAFGDTAKEQEFNEQLLALNRAMQDGRLSATEYAEAVQQLRFQFGEGGAATGVREFFAALQEGGQTSKQVFSLLQNGLDGFSQNLSEMLATGKANWSDYFASIEEMIIKSDLANLLKSALGFLNNSNFFTSGFLGNFFGGGGLFGPIGSGHASGGPVDAGTIYPVGEHGIEFFKPSVPGQILTGDQFRRQLGTPKAGGQVINMPVTINGVTDVDSFKKSMPQVRAELYRGAAQAHGRFNR